MTINHKTVRYGLTVAAVMTAMVLVTGTIMPVITPAFASTSVDGRAVALSVKSTLGSVNFMDTGALSASGNYAEAVPVTIQNSLAKADGLLSTTMGTDSAQSQSALGALVLLPNTPNQITAYFTMASARATCSGVSGSSDITDLTLAGKQIQVTGQPNQVVSVPGVLTLTINEQKTSPGSITVNALHLHTALGSDVIVSSAQSTVSCSTAGTALSTLSLGLVKTAYGWGVPSTPGCVDFTTGGGWVNPPPNKGTFGFVAGYKNGGPDPRGNLEYHDHTIEMNVHADDVLYYNCGSYDNSRVFGGDTEVNGAPGYCYQVYAQDNGEPGSNTDYFAMWIWNAPATGCPSDGSIPGGTPIYAVGNYLGDGDIQLHT